MSDVTWDKVWYKVTQQRQQPSYGLTTRASRGASFVSKNFKTMNFVACECGIYNNHGFKCKYWAQRNCCAKKNKWLWSYLKGFGLLLLIFFSGKWRDQHCFCLEWKLKIDVSHFGMIISWHPSGVMTLGLMIASNYHFHQTLPLEGFPNQDIDHIMTAVTWLQCTCWLSRV